MHFHYMTYIAMPQHKNPCSGVHEIYNFGRTFLGYHYYLLSLSDLCLGVEKKVLKEIMPFHFMTYKAMAQHKNPCPSGHDIYSFGRTFLGHHYYIVSSSDLCQGVEKRILKEIIHFHYMTYMAMPQHKTPWSGVQEIYNFGRPFLGHYYCILSLPDLCLEVEMKIFKEGQRPQNLSSCMNYICGIIIHQKLNENTNLLKLSIPAAVNENSSV